MKITLATIKSFIKKNDDLQINVQSSFDGMYDGVMSRGEGFLKAERLEGSHGHDNELGVKGVWCVFGSRDQFMPYETDTMTGFKVYNCCGSFILAVTKQA